MADQVTGNVTGAPGKVQGATGGLQGGIENATTGVLATISGWGGYVAQKGKEILDRVIPPETRAKLLDKIQKFMLANPKISAFLGMNAMITGVPLFLFVLFSLTVLIFSLLVGLILGLLAAVLFTVFMIGVALTIVLPTIFFTTASACFLFLWGLGGYYIFKWANGDEEGQSGESGPSIGDRLNSLTGGRLTGFMDSAKAADAKKDIKGYGDEYTKPKSNGPDTKPKAHSADTKPKANGTAEKKVNPDGESIGAGRVVQKSGADNSLTGPVNDVKHNVTRASQDLGKSGKIVFG